MLYWIIIGVLIVGIIAVIFFTVSKLLKEKKDYNQFERRYPLYSSILKESLTIPSITTSPVPSSFPSL